MSLGVAQHTVWDRQPAVLALVDEIDAEAKQIERTTGALDQSAVRREVGKRDRDFGIGSLISHQHHPEKRMRKPLTCLVRRLRWFGLTALRSVVIGGGRIALHLDGKPPFIFRGHEIN